MLSLLKFDLRPNDQKSELAPAIPLNSDLVQAKKTQNVLFLDEVAVSPEYP